MTTPTETADRLTPHPLAPALGVLKAIASLRLTVVLFALAIALVFLGTIAQVDAGIWTVVDKYFWSWYVMVPVELFHKFGQVFFDLPKNTPPWDGAFPFPAGKLLGGLMLLNLVAAHLVRFKLAWRRAGVLLIHSGLILLFVGEFVTREYAVEQRMTIPENQSVNYAEDTRHVELAIVDRSNPTEDRVSVVPQSVLKGGGRISHPDLPVEIEVLDYFVNASVTPVERAKAGTPNPATAGVGQAVIAEKRGEVSGVDPNQAVDMPAAYLRLFKPGTQEPIAVHLASLYLYRLKMTDDLVIDGKKYEMALRFKRYYKPYRIELLDFKFDRYPGTQKPRNYSSDVKVFDAAGNLVREQTIRMNEPLRFAGETFYQSSFENEGEAVESTVLQVVKNPGWLIPYISCVLVSVGLLLHFGLMLGRFLTRREATAAAPDAPDAPAAPDARGWFQRNLYKVAVAGVALYLLGVYGRMKPKDEYDLNTFSQVPVLDGGRVKPLDSAARVYLRSISGKSVFDDERKNEQPAIKWYMDTLAATPGSDRDAAWKHHVIRIDNEQVLSLVKLPVREGLRYSLNELRPQLASIDAKAKAAAEKRRGKKQLDTTEAKTIELAERMQLMMQVARGRGHDTDSNTFHLLPPRTAGEKWASLGQVREDAEALAYAEAVRAARSKLGKVDASAFFQKMLGQHMRDANGDFLKQLSETFFTIDPDMHKPEMRNELLGALLAEVPPGDAAAIRDRRAERYKAKLAEHPAAVAWEGMIAAYKSGNAAEFNRLVADYRETFLGFVTPDEQKATKLELNYNRFSPFLRCAGLYVIALVMCLGGFVAKAAEKPHWGEALRRAGFHVLLATLALHTGALVVRMSLMDRPLVFVTNLYSSAVFIGWGCVCLGLILERLYPIGIGNAVAAVLGVSTTIVAHNLATDDTLEMMQAVLDTNFWLATHVTTVTLGYTATFVAGFLGAVYVFQMLAAVVRDSFLDPKADAGHLLAFGAAAMGLVAIPLLTAWPVVHALGKFELVPSFVSEMIPYLLALVGLVYAFTLLVQRASRDGSPQSRGIPKSAELVASMGLTPAVSAVLGKMVYGVLAFATLLSFVGTVLGGIWADQSWGRFWGWDPKENGAVLIVLWNSLILHARWCGLVKARGVAVLAIFGNVITAWSWFGTNQLGIGLHAYGFDTRLADGCANFWLGMMLILLLGLIPAKFWPSGTGRAPAATQTAAAEPPEPRGGKQRFRKRT